MLAVPLGRTDRHIADGLRQAGQPDEALPFYEQAATEAESAEHWADLAVISQN